jgi:hypothetical protein
MTHRHEEGRGARALRPSLVLLALLVAAVAGGHAPPAQASAPVHGTLVVGTSLGGVRLGDTPAAVRARWGSRYTRCGVCPATTWLYMIRGSRLAGAAVTFRAGHAAAVFTLGAPVGWRSSRGLAVGDPAIRVPQLHSGLRYSRCVGYGALSVRRGGVVTSIYTFGDVVYGFALTRPREPVCQ